MRGLRRPEALNIPPGGERNGEATVQQAEAFASRAENPPVAVDSPRWKQSSGRTMVPVRSRGPGSHDADCPEPAVRGSLTLVSPDGMPAKAAEGAGVTGCLENHREQTQPVSHSARTAVQLPPGEPGASPEFQRFIRLSIRLSTTDGSASVEISPRSA